MAGVPNIESLIGTPIDRWEPENYTAAGIGGPQGAALHTELAQNVRRRGDTITDLLR